MKKLVIIITLLLSNSVFAQEVERTDTTWLTIELNTLKSSLIENTSSFTVPPETYEQSLFDSMQLIDRNYVLGNNFLTDLLKTEFSVIDTGEIQEITYDTSFQVPTLYSDTVFENQYIRNNFICSKHFYNTITIGNTVHTNSYLFYVKQLWVGKLDRLDSNYMLTHYFAVVDTSNKVVSSMKYVSVNDYYDSTTDKLYGIGNRFKIMESISSSFLRMAKENEMGKFIVYPNPCSQFINIAFKPSNTKSYKIDLIDNSGKTIQSMMTNILEKEIIHTINFKFDLIITGNYILRISNDKENLTQLITISN